MQTNSVYQTVQSGLAVGVILFVIFFSGVHFAQAATCTITRDLQFGMVGDDVLCLQKWLNSNGYPIAEAGPGASGNETDEYKALTQAAVQRWQLASNISPANGMFGPKSRAVMAGGVASDSTPTPTVAGVSTNAGSIESLMAVVQSLLTKIADLEKRIAVLEAKPLTASNSTNNNSTLSAKERRTKTFNVIRAAESDIDEASDEVNEADEDGESIGDADELLRKAQAKIDDAWDAYDNGDYSDAEELIEDFDSLIEEALAEIGEEDARERDDDEAEDLMEELEDLRDELDDAWDEVDAALDNDEDVGDAEEYLEEAEDALDDAEDAIDDGDYDEAEEYLDEAEDFIEDALDELKS